jgi:hypothetical protein
MKRWYNVTQNCIDFSNYLWKDLMKKYPFEIQVDPIAFSTCGELLTKYSITLCKLYLKDLSLFSYCIHLGLLFCLLGRWYVRVCSSLPLSIFNKLYCGSLSLQHGMSSGCGWRNSLQLWRLAANILNKQLRTNDKGWSSSLRVGHGANNHSP